MLIDLDHVPQLASESADVIRTCRDRHAQIALREGATPRRFAMVMEWITGRLRSR
jgi:hypothetical protein